MKNFLKLVFANLVAMFILIGTMVGFMFLFIIIGASSGDSKLKVKGNSVLIMNNETTILDSPSEEKIDFLSFGKKGNSLTIYEALEAIKNAKTDENIKGISIEADFINANLTHIDNIRTAIEDFKKSGKFVYAYGNNVSQSSYYLGSVADRYFLNPVGGIELKGLASEVVYMKEFAEKYGIGFSVLRYGKYKSAIENLLRDDISEENREQLTALLNGIWEEISPKMIASRKMNPTHFNRVVDSLDAFIAESALKNKLVDELAHKSAFQNFIKNKLNVKEGEELNTISINAYATTIEKKADEKESVAVLYASGAINSGKGANGIRSESIIKEIKRLADDEVVKAVVLRVNSPGGSANASDEILYELHQLKAKKPLVISFGDYAASGGYYIAMAGDRIFSEPNTLTGSIGVFGVVPNVKELANKNGFHAYDVQTHANSSFHSIINGLKPGAETMLTRSVEITYKQFVAHVMKNRKMTYQQVDNIAQGRVWTGKMALKNGLVDELGTLEDAIKFAAQKANLKKYNVETYPSKTSPFEQFLQDLEEEPFTAKLLERKLGRGNYQVLQMFLQDRKNAEIMMAMPYQITIQ